MCTKFRRKQPVVNGGPIDLWLVAKICFGAALVAFAVGYVAGA